MWSKRILIVAATLLVATMLLLSPVQARILARPHVTHAQAKHGHVVAPAAGASVSIDLSKALVNVSADLWGIFFEELNHAGVGGLFNEQIQNSNFEIGQFSANYDPWTILPPPSGVTAFISLNQDMPLTAYSPYSIFVQASGGSGTVGIYNPGFWGINTIGITSYTVSFWAYATSGVTATTPITASIVSNTTTTTYGSASITGLTSTWQQFTVTVTLNSPASDPQAGFTLTFPVSSGTMSKVYFDVISVMPNNGWNGLPFIRPDLGEMVAQLHPAFMRFPGGCYVEGDKLADRFNWKNALGPRENRRGHNGLWGYYSEDYLGLYEYMTFIEKLTDVYGNPTRAIWVVNNGISHSDEIPSNEIASWVQDALDSVEFIRGDSSTPYGSIRASMGHPEPFMSLAFLAIGNEDCGKQWYNTNYQAFYTALSAAHPDIKLIANCDMTPANLPTQWWDYHTYNTPDWFIQNQGTLDNQARNGVKIFNSEYAVTTGANHGNAIAGVAEAVWMNGLERNSDLVTIASYAPLFVNVNNRAWSPDAINFDSAQVYGTPSYWTQYMYANAYWGAVSGTVQTVSNAVSGNSQLYSAATWGTLNSTVSAQYGATTFLCVKVVNTVATSAAATVSLANVPAGATILKSAEVMTMMSTDPNLENSFAAPTAVAPVSSQLTVTGTSFSYTFPSYSVTIMRFYLNL